VENVGPFFDKRTGPIVAIAAGSLSQSDAQTLLGAVNYEASVTWNENTYFDKKNNVANLLVNIIILCIVIGAISLAAGVAFGGVRVLFRRYFSGKADEVEFISLDLSEVSIQVVSEQNSDSSEPSKTA
jgi:vacuolar-type H+-ATPase subunit I/STV1